MFSRKSVAGALGGTITKSGTIRAPFPGGDRTFEIDLDADHPDGFLVVGYHKESNPLTRPRGRVDGEMAASKNLVWTAISVENGKLPLDGG
jgi:hypothetical protein